MVLIFAYRRIGPQTYQVLRDHVHPIGTVTRLGRQRWRHERSPELYRTRADAATALLFARDLAEGVTLPAY